MVDTIAAISTPLAEGAISIIKVSGDQAIEFVNKIFDRDLNKFARNTINYGNIIDENNNIVDEVMVSVFRAPYSFTREDVVEINTHGGILVTRTVLSLLLGVGVRLATPGEFSQRAYLNGRLDLTQAEAINDLISASNTSGMKVALSGLKGSIKRLLDPLIEDILNTIATIEVNIDYPEYDDVEILSNEIVKPSVIDWLKQLDIIIKRAKMTQEIKDGVKTVIIGEPNVGKSSIFNALIEKDKAIVTHIAGTTRDLVEDKIHLDNVTLSLIDTAGLRETDDLVEQIGISKTQNAIDEAEFIIMVLDSSRSVNEFELDLMAKIKDKRHIIVNNKSDINSVGEISVSALNEDISELIPAINGEVSRDDLLDTLFSKFCLGK